MRRYACACSVPAEIACAHGLRKGTACCMSPQCACRNCVHAEIACRPQYQLVHNSAELLAFLMGVVSVHVRRQVPLRKRPVPLRIDIGANRSEPLSLPNSPVLWSLLCCSFLSFIACVYYLSSVLFMHLGFLVDAALLQSLSVRQAPLRIRPVPLRMEARDHWNSGGFSRECRVTARMPL